MMTMTHTHTNTLTAATLPAAIETATLGGGCFWCTEAVFLQVRGVLSVESGYADGQTVNPTYEDICTGNSGHAEVVQIQFDPASISYEQVLHIFFNTHDATTLNRQGNDVGTQYRSIVLTHSASQMATAQAVLLEAQSNHRATIVTQLKTMADSVYYPAEAYHQNYYAKHPFQGYCAAVVAPKVAKFKQTMHQFMA
jgi:peptide-methionine (S)-S-oxide reductase